MTSDAALDFWLGSWTCTWAGGHGTNDITRELGDRVVVERFRASAPRPFEGLSVSAFDPISGWRQTWVDSNGSYWHFVGSPRTEGFTFVTPDRVDADQLFKRMVFSNIADTGLDWRWESSGDGSTWTENWAIRYARR